MLYVNHITWGKGTVIKREIAKDGRFIEVSEGGNYINVRFANGKEARFAMPASFEKGVIRAIGTLNDEVEESIASSRVLKEEKKADSLAGMVKPVVSPRGRSSRYVVQGAIERAFEDYLIRERYRTKTPSGHDSTVYSYIKAIKNDVLEEEGISWDTLKTEIARIVPMYDNGGAKELIGSKSNNTVICALKCFEKFVDVNP
jgi:hypothetical protein